jgi:hypothetical protein
MPSGNPPTHIILIAYTARGQIDLSQYCNSTETSFTYSARRGWLTRVKTLQGKTPIFNLQYARDLKGQIAVVTSGTGVAGFDNPRSLTYTCDSLNRLEQTDRLERPTGNRTFKSDVAIDRVLRANPVTDRLHRLSESRLVAQTKDAFPCPIPCPTIRSPSTACRWPESRVPWV